jgi:hypothetical protein
VKCQIKKNEAAAEALVAVVVERLSDPNKSIPLVPIGSLIILLHSATRILSDVSNPRDGAEARNYRLYAKLMPWSAANYVNASISGAFKPPDFIHRFEDYYSLPGYLDQQVLSAFFAAVDCRAGKIAAANYSCSH